MLIRNCFKWDEGGIFVFQTLSGLKKTLTGLVDAKPDSVCKTCQCLDTGFHSPADKRDFQQAHGDRIM